MVVTHERQVHRLRQLLAGLAQIADGERDHAEAEVGEERQGNAGDDVSGRWVAAEGEEAKVDVDDRDGDEDDEDGEQNDDDQRLSSVDELGADEVDRDHGDHDDRGEDVVPAARRVVAYEQ